jgi:UDP-N-acetylmuramate--alanine ligase
MDNGSLLPSSLEGYAVHFVGIKGTGMTALAEVLSARGARVTGSDTAEKFYTDEILKRLKIPVLEGFSARHIPAGAKLVIHSAAYSRDDNPELLEARRRKTPIINYPEALGILSVSCDSTAVSGVHGKSTTTAMCGVILKAWGFPATVIVGTEVPAFGGRSTLVQGEKYLVAETCEYRRHFLNFHPQRIAITSIDADHLDYFKDLGDISEAFTTFGCALPDRGTLVYCADDAGASEAANRIRSARGDITIVPYGVNTDGDFRVTELIQGQGRTTFSLAGFPVQFTLKVPGAHTVLNAACALALCSGLWRAERAGEDMDADAAARALAEFTGSRRRSEILGEAGGVTFIDDYAHHPTAVEKTLAGYAVFYSGRRIIVDFMPHTYSRTKTLLSEFGRCFGPANEVILNGIYASAREAGAGTVSGRDLYEEVSRNHPRVSYVERPEDAVDFIAERLQPGDVFVTMGAGNNWTIGREIFRLRGGSA